MYIFQRRPFWVIFRTTSNVPRHSGVSSHRFPRSWLGTNWCPFLSSSADWQSTKALACGVGPLSLWGPLSFGGLDPHRFKSLLCIPIGLAAFPGRPGGDLGWRCELEPKGFFCTPLMLERETWHFSLVKDYTDWSRVLVTNQCCLGIVGLFRSSFKIFLLRVKHWQIICNQLLIQKLMNTMIKCNLTTETLWNNCSFIHSTDTAYLWHTSLYSGWITKYDLILKIGKGF